MTGVTTTDFPRAQRPLGAFERSYDLWSREHPMHFCVVAELEGDVEYDRLRTALDRVQARHPLLRVRIVDHGDDLLARSATFEPAGSTIALRIADGEGWEHVVAEELGHRIDQHSGPLVRAVLVRPGPALVLTFEHSIADGVSATGVLADAVDALNGRPLPPLPVPPPQEELVAHLPRRGTGPAPEAGDDDPRLTAPPLLRPFDGAHPRVSALAWTTEETAVLRSRCHAEGTTVNGAVVAAAVVVVSDARTREYLRVNIPYSLRDVVPIEDSVALYIGGLRPGYPIEDSRDLFATARRTSTATQVARSNAAVLAVSDGVQKVMGGGLSQSAALDALMAANGFDLLISNLGRLAPRDPSGAGPVRAKAVWGPMLLNQVQGEEMLGVVTTGDRLRMVHVGHDPTPQLLWRIRRLLVG